MGKAHVDILRRSDPVMYVLEDRSQFDRVIIGQTPDQGTPTAEKSWQLRCYYFDGNVISTVFANHEKYNQVWDDRVNLFSFLPPGQPYPGMVVSGTVSVIPPPVQLFHEYDEDAYIPGTYVNILTHIVPLGQSWFLETAELSAPVTGVVRVKRNSDIIAVGNLNPAKTVYSLKVPNGIPMAAGDTITVEFCARVNAPAGSAYSFIHGNIQ